MRSSIPAVNWLLILMFFSVLNGCAGREALPRFVWPPPPDQPRLEYVGNYYSEASFEKTSTQSWIKNLVGERGEATFQTPFGIVSNGKGVVYISDIHLKNVRVYDFNNKTVNFLTKVTKMGVPAGVALDGQGNLYIADSGLGQILVYGPKGEPIKTIGDNKELSKPSYLVIDKKNERLYVTDGLKHKIVVFSLQGQYIKSIGDVGNDPGKFFSPQGITIGPDGNLYVCDMYNARVQVLTTDGEFVRMFGERGDQPGQFENPKDLAFDSDGNLHVIEGRRSDLLTFTPEGKLLLVTGNGSATPATFGFAAPRGIAIDSTDRIFVTEALNHRFTVWQYMSKSWLEKNPYTDEDRKKLINYSEKLAKEEQENQAGGAK